MCFTAVFKLQLKQGFVFTATDYVSIHSVTKGQILFRFIMIACQKPLVNISNFFQRLKILIKNFLCNILVLYFFTLFQERRKVHISFINFLNRNFYFIPNYTDIFLNKTKKLPNIFHDFDSMN